MNKKKKVKIIIIGFSLLIVIIGICSFISYSKFNVLNSLSTANGLFQVVFAEKEYIEIQKYPKINLSANLNSS